MKPIELHNFPGREVIWNDKNYLYFGGTSYLGLQSLDGFTQTYSRNLLIYGTHYGASRNSNIRLGTYHKAEAYLADWIGAEASLCMSSGYLAGQLVTEYLLSSGHKLFHAPGVHSALSRGFSEVYSDYTTLRKALENHLATNPEATPAVLLDSIIIQEDSFPYYGDLKNLPLENCILVADDSHGIGVVGIKGSGTYEKLIELGARELILCCSLGKSMGIPAGCVAGNAGRIEQFRKTAFFGGASPPQAAGLATIVEKETLIQEAIQLLHHNNTTFLSTLNHGHNLQYIENYPVYECTDEELFEYLFEKGIIITSFRYPSETDPPQNRIVISAFHTKTDLSLLSSAINNFYRDHTIK